MFTAGPPLGIVAHRRGLLSGRNVSVISDLAYEFIFVCVVENSLVFIGRLAQHCPISFCIILIKARGPTAIHTTQPAATQTFTDTLKNVLLLMKNVIKLILGNCSIIQLSLPDIF